MSTPMLTGCKSSDYKKAVELQNSGDYAGALELFKGIGDDYKDVSYMVNNSSSRKRYASPKAGTELYLDLVFRQ